MGYHFIFFTTIDYSPLFLASIREFISRLLFHLDHEMLFVENINYNSQSYISLLMEIFNTPILRLSTVRMRVVDSSGTEQTYVSRVPSQNRPNSCNCPYMDIKVSSSAVKSKSGEAFPMFTRRYKSSKHHNNEPQPTIFRIIRRYGYE